MHENTQPQQTVMDNCRHSLNRECPTNVSNPLMLHRAVKQVNIEYALLSTLLAVWSVLIESIDFAI